MHSSAFGAGRAVDQLLRCCQEHIYMHVGMFLKNLVQDPSISQTMATLAALAPSQDRLLECAHPCSCIRVFTHSNSRILNLQSCIYIYIYI